MLEREGRMPRVLLKIAQKRKRIRDVGGIDPGMSYLFSESGCLEMHLPLKFEVWREDSFLTCGPTHK